ncbi:hypothetical protein QVD17_00961 [Tagetes erecta]|uniref:Uncharacterized protein n=1 Tax=Tagetes erecta TaxID=13708 RepID=A0AAD8L444_TARER|nr:hypothetical protein QVD17_00961 [Tagetes erecta]
MLRITPMEMGYSGWVMEVRSGYEALWFRLLCMFAVAYVDEDDFSSETVMTLRCGKTVVAGDDFCGHCFRVSTLLVVNVLIGSGRSECGTVDFTREDVLPLLNERIRPKDKYTLKEKRDVITDYIKWFQELQADLLLQQEKHVKTLDSAEKKCSDILIWV